MFANRFTAFVDACSLVSVLRRNLLLTLAEADFFRIRWSAEVLDETERALVKMFETKNDPAEAVAKAATARKFMEEAFDGAAVTGYESLINTTGLPDPKDGHVIAAAVKTRASIIVTENLKDFPSAILHPLDLEAKSADAFLADIIDLDPGRAVPAIRELRLRLKRPEKTPEALFLDMERDGLIQTVDSLREHQLSL